MAQSLVQSEILRIAGEVRAMLREGADILNLTVGDFNSQQFPIPKRLSEGIKKALDDGHSNYPPPQGVPECRAAVQHLFREHLGLDYPLDSVLITSGARPAIAGTYMSLINPGDPVVYSLPSWNNNHYSTLIGAEKIEVSTTSATAFFPRAEDLAPSIGRARLVCLNTPQNPTGTVMDPKQLEALCRSIVEENHRREAEGRPNLYLMFDQVYWMLTYRGATHATPVGLVPEIAPYTIFVDGLSKGFAATGLRVGWAVGPEDVIQRMSKILTHLGAWAPRPEQVATSELLVDGDAVAQHRSQMAERALSRLDVLKNAIDQLAADGHPVEAIPPAGAIYLSMKIDVAGKKTPGGEVLRTDDDIRAYLLREARIAIVPFYAFGLPEGTGWFRASVGAVSTEDCQRGTERLRAALEKLR
jgi:aspartate aminotransferase